MEIDDVLITDDRWIGAALVTLLIGGVTARGPSLQRVSWKVTSGVACLLHQMAICVGVIRGGSGGRQEEKMRVLLIKIDGNAT